MVLLAALESIPYRVPRLRLAYVAAEEYVRTFWYFVVAVPLGGIFLMSTGERTMQALGMLALLWPFSIPARAIFISSRASRLFAGGAVVRITEADVEFLGTQPGRTGKPLRFAIPRSSVRDVVTRQGLLIVRTFGLSFAPIEPSAISPEFQASLKQLRIVSEDSE